MTLKDFLLKDPKWRVEGSDSILEDFLHYINNNITIEDKALRVVTNIAGGLATKRQEQEARASSPFHVLVFMFSLFLILKKDLDFVVLLNPLCSPLIDMNEWCSDRLIYLKSNFELRYGGLQPKVINNSSMLINHLLPLAEIGVSNRTHRLMVLTEAVFYCIDNIYTKLRNSTALTNRGSDFIMATYDRLEYFSKLIPNLADKAV
jgi:hypothetical protein